ncbi:MAG: hypothetical protein AAFR61_13035 [Bacteroidota bacterium]
MSNVFKELEANEKLPPEVKEQTLSTLSSVKLIMDFVDLFVVKAGRAFSATMSGNTSPTDTPQKDSRE